MVLDSMVSEAGGVHSSPQRPNPELKVSACSWGTSRGGKLPTPTLVRPREHVTIGVGPEPAFFYKSRESQEPLSTGIVGFLRETRKELDK